MLTAWDGYARVDYLPAEQRVRITLLTVEPLVHRRVRDGLVCAFVEGDATGPPAYVEMHAKLGSTEVLLLGSELADVVRYLLKTEKPTTHTRLNLDEVAGLADRWAPYRGDILGTAPQHGKLAGGLWARLGAAAIRTVLNKIPLALDPAYRDHHETGFDWRSFHLHASVAQHAEVEQVAHWVVYRQLGEYGEEETGIVVRATALPNRTTTLFASLDEADADWAEFQPDPEDPSSLLADLPVDPRAEVPALRFRSDRRIDV